MNRLWAIAFLVASCGGTAGPGSPTPTVSGAPTPTASPLFDYSGDLPIGQCFDPIRDKDDDIVLAARLKSCDEAHLAEITGQLELPDAAGTPYPGDKLVADTSEKECGSAFKDYVGIDYDLSRIEAEYSYPSQDTWLGGDRRVTCFVVGTEVAPLTRSVKGSRQ